MILYYVRHGDPIYDPDSLTPLGERQAEEVGRRLSLHGLDKIYTSSSQRAKQTAKPACEMLHIEPTVLDWTNEGYAWREMAVDCEYGHTWCFYSGKYIEKFRSNEVLSLGRKWYTHPYFAQTHFAEGMERIQRETDNLLASLGYEHDLEHNCYNAVNPTSERIALFAHQGFGLSFLSCLLDIPYTLFATGCDMSHSCVSVIYFTEAKGKTVPKLWQLSNDSHLYAGGLPTRYNNGLYI